MQAKKRLKWADENENRDWDEVLWSDEALFETGERLGRKLVLRRAGEEFQEDTIDVTYRSGRKSLMVWASIANNKVGPIMRLETTPETIDEKGKKKGGGINGPRYVAQVLEGLIKEWITFMEKERGCTMYMVEDGAQPHRAVVSKRTRERLGIKNLNHSPNSPDLNPIEPLWLVVKDCVADIPGSSNSLDNLWEAIKKVWENLSEEDVQKHTSQMHARVEAVRAAGGFHTHF